MGIGLQETRQNLGRYVADLDQLEREIDQRLVRVGPQLASHRRAAEAVSRWGEVARRHRAALETPAGVSAAGARGGTGIRPFPAIATDATDATEPRVGRATQALLGLYVAFNHAALGYAILHAVAHRFFDSQAEGNAADLAESHMRDYAGAAQEINQLISDAVARDLSAEALDCQCQCPSCGLGVCLCAPHGTTTVNQAWRETTPAAPSEPGITVRPPRAGSPAAQAGLRDGDRVLAVDDQPIQSDLDTTAIQGAIRKRGSGEQLVLRVARLGGQTEEIRVARP